MGWTLLTVAAASFFLGMFVGIQVCRHAVLAELKAFRDEARRKRLAMIAEIKK